MNDYDENFKNVEVSDEGSDEEIILESPKTIKERNKIPKIIENDNSDIIKPEKKKVKREMTAERKAKLLENLARGRITAQKNRQKKAEYNKLIREKNRKDERKKIDDVLEEDYKKRTSKHNEYNKLELEIKELRKQLENKPKLESVEEENLDFLEVPKIIKEKPKIISSGRLKLGSRWR